MDKVTVIGDAVKAITQLRAEAHQLRQFKKLLEVSAGFEYPGSALPGLVLRKCTHYKACRERRLCLGYGLWRCIRQRCPQALSSFIGSIKCV